MTSFSRRRLRHTLVGFTAAALTLSGSLTSPASAVTPAPAADQASSWLAGELTNNMITTDFGGTSYPDWGLTFDVALAMTAAGNQAAKLDRVVNKLKRGIDEYVSYEGDLYANSLAKALTAASAFGEDPTSFGGRDLQADVLGVVAADDAGFEAGRVRDTGESYPDSSNTFGQSFAVIGLTRAGEAPQSTVDYLLKQQCADGFFRLYITAEETCDASGSEADVDASAIAIQALVAAKADGLSVPSGKYKLAVRWLRAMQADSGAFGSSPSIPVKNTNSTSLAATALVAAGSSAAAKKARTWVLSVQLKKGETGKRNVGAIAYNKKSYNAAKKNGLGSSRDQFRRASAQGILALTGKSLVTLKSR